MKTIKKWMAVTVVLLSITIFNGCNTYRQGTYGSQASYENPQWGPAGYNGSRYYYLPDIECYYDIYNREFIYLNHAQWIYSPYVPLMYQNFNLNNSFVVVVNSNIYQPWMHHQYYVSHFPRYYYRDYYDYSNIPYVRGFNENSRSAIFWSENERDRARSWNDDNLRSGRQFRYSREDLQHQIRTNNTGAFNPSDSRYGDENSRNIPGSYTNQAGNSVYNPVIRQPQKEDVKIIPPAGTDNATPRQQSTTPDVRRTHETNYYGKPIGQPVKADRQMRIQNTTVPADRSSDRNTTQRSSGGSTTNQNNQGRR